MINASKLTLLITALGLVLCTTKVAGQDSVTGPKLASGENKKVLEGFLMDGDSAPTRVHRRSPDEAATRIHPADAQITSMIFDSESAKTDGFADGGKGTALDAEAESGILKLAWEEWHKRVTRAMFERCHRTSGDGGACTYVLTVTRKGAVDIKTYDSVGDPTVTQVIIKAALELDGTALLAFPENSKRERVTQTQRFTSGAYLQHHGYTWDKNDFETVQYKR